VQGKVCCASHQLLFMYCLLETSFYRNNLDTLEMSLKTDFGC